MEAPGPTAVRQAEAAEWGPLSASSAYTPTGIVGCSKNTNSDVKSRATQRKALWPNITKGCIMKRQEHGWRSSDKQPRNETKERTHTKPREMGNMQASTLLGGQEKPSVSNIAWGKRNKRIRNDESKEKARYQGTWAPSQKGRMAGASKSPTVVNSTPTLRSADGIKGLKTLPA